MIEDMNTTGAETMTKTIHPFEARGLGKAPFRYIGMEVQDIAYGQVILNHEEYQRTGIMVSTAPGGSCAYCGTYIVHMFNVRSSDGKTFHVGSDCIEKVGGVKLRHESSDDVRKLRRAAAERAKARLIERVKADVAAFDATSLAELPHPNDYFAGQGLTALDWFEYMVKNASARTMVGVLKEARELAGKAQAREAAATATERDERRHFNSREK